MPPTQSPEVASSPSSTTSPCSPSSTNKPFSCEFCSFTTHNGPSIKKHRARHTGEGMMTCGECKYQTIHPYLMKIHNATYHTGEGLIRCPHCKFKTARRERYRNHLKLHIKTGDAKPDALQIFNEKCAIETKEKRKAERIRIKEESLKKSSGTEKLSAVKSVASPCPKSEDDSNSNSSSSFQSNRSALKIASDSSLNSSVHSDDVKRQSLLAPNGRDPSVNSYTNGSSYLTNQENIIQIENSCDGDGFTAPTESYACNQCNFVTSNKRVFVRHKRRHDQERMFCEFCSFSTSNRACMQVHKATHKGIRKALCPFCDFSSASQHLMNRHVISHSSITPSTTDHDTDIDDVEGFSGGIERENNGPFPLGGNGNPFPITVNSCLDNYYHTKGFLNDKLQPSRKLSAQSKQNIYLQTSGVLFDEYSMSVS